MKIDTKSLSLLCDLVFESQCSTIKELNKAEDDFKQALLFMESKRKEFHEATAKADALRIKISELTEKERSLEQIQGLNCYYWDTFHKDEDEKEVSPKEEPSHSADISIRCSD